MLMKLRRGTRGNIAWMLGVMVGVCGLGYMRTRHWRLSRRRGPDEDDRVSRSHMMLFVPCIWPLRITKVARQLLVRIDFWMFCIRVVHEQLSSVSASKNLPTQEHDVWPFGPVFLATSDAFCYVGLASISAWVHNFITTFALYLLVRVRHGVSCFGRHDLADGLV